MNIKIQIELTAIVTGLMLLGGCATSPEKIAPEYVSETSYMQWTCDQLVQEQPRLMSALSDASAKQKHAANEDTFGVLILGFPISGKDNIGYEVARLKGELVALRGAAAKKGCNLPPLPESLLNPPEPTVVSPTKGHR